MVEGGEDSYPSLIPLPPNMMVIENVMLSMTAWWKLTETTEKVVELVTKHFTQDEVIGGLRSIFELGIQFEFPPRRNPSQGRSAVKAQAMDLVRILEDLTNQDRLPKFVIHSEELGRVSHMMGTLSIRDEQSVSARLESLEAGMKKMMEVMDRTVNKQQSGPTMSSFRSIPSINVPTPPINGGYAAAVAANTGVGGEGSAGGARGGGGGEVGG